MPLARACVQIWRDYCHYRRLPGELRRRVMAYINTAHSNKRVLDDTSMLLVRDAAVP